MAVNEICAHRSKKLNARTVNDNFEDLIQEAVVSQDSPPVRIFLILKINFLTKSFHELFIEIKSSTIKKKQIRFSGEIKDFLLIIVM